MPMKDECKGKVTEAYCQYICQHRYNCGLWLDEWNRNRKQIDENNSEDEVD